MHESPSDLKDLQRLLDRSHGAGGSHLRSILLDDRRLSATDLVAALPGVQILSLATVTAACEPRVGGVDGLFFRGHFYFGSSPESFRFRHLSSRPQVSASHLRGEELAIVVHGHAQMVDTAAQENDQFRSYLIEVYGQQWAEWGAGASYARIDPTKMFASRLPGETS